MKNKNVLKLLLSLSLGLLFILMMNVKTTGLLFHEVFGIIIFIGIIVHNIFNWNWTKGVSKNILKNKVILRAKLMYILVIILCLNLLTITITGILMSKYILSSISASNILLVKFIHKYSSYFAVGAVSIHFLLHTKYVLTSLKKVFTNISDRGVRVALSQFSIAVLLIVVLYFPLTTYLTSNDPSYDDIDIILEEMLDKVPSENMELLTDHSTTDKEDDAAINSEDEIASEIDDSKSEIANNDLYNAESIKNNDSLNTEVDKNTAQNNTTVENKPQNNTNNTTNNNTTSNTSNSNNNNSESKPPVNTPVVTPPVSEPPVVTPPVEEDKKEDNSTIESGNSLQPELTAYLGRLGCNGCERGCMLDAPFCTIGIEKAERAKDKFLQFHTYNISDDEFIIIV